MCPGWIKVYFFLPKTNLTQVYPKPLNGSASIKIVYYKIKRKRDVIKHKEIFCIQNPAQNAKGHGPHQSEWPQRLSAYRNRIIAKSKGAQHLTPPPLQTRTHTNLSAPPSRPFISGPPLQTHERMLCGDSGEKERGRKERENIKAGLCVESSGGVCACVWGGNGQKGLALLSAYVKGSLEPLLYRTQHCINIPDTLQRHTQGGGVSGGV